MNLPKKTRCFHSEKATMIRRTQLSERLGSLDIMGAQLRCTPETPQNYGVEGFSSRTVEKLLK